MSWLFLKGLPATCPFVPCNGRRVALAQALPDARQAGDISKKIPPGLAVVKICGVYTVKALGVSVWFI